MEYHLELKAWMEENRYTTALLARKIGVSRNYLSTVINGNKKMSDKLQLLIETFIEAHQ